MGWNVVKCLASRHQLTVMTRGNNRSSIESVGQEWVQSVRWVYVDVPRWISFWKRGARGARLYYALWQVWAYFEARRLVRDGNIDLAHHVTFGTYWLPSPLARLSVPFVFGPVGGGDDCPPGLLKDLPLRDRWAEILHGTVKKIVPRLPLLRALYPRAGWTFAATEATAERLGSLGARGMSVLAQSGIGGDELEAYCRSRIGSAEGCGRQRGTGPLRLVTACRLIRWKAVDLAVEAVAEARSRGADVVMEILQSGPEKETLERLIGGLGLQGKVTMVGRLKTLEDVYERIRNADALIHPAMHEAFGQACLEALALGVPVISLDWGGPGVIVSEDCGYKIIPGSRAETVSRLADAMVALARSPGRTAEMGARARERAFGRFSWEGLVAEMEKCYRTLTEVRAHHGKSGSENKKHV